MVRRKTVGSIVFDSFNVILLISVSLVCFYPFLYVVFASFSGSNMLEYYRGVLWKPLGFSIEAYKAVFQNIEVWTGYGNTIFYVVVGTALSLIMTSLGAYVLARTDFFWNKVLLPLVMFTMFFHGGMIPAFLLVKAIGLYDTRWAVIIPVLINTWNLFIMRTNFAALPKSLEEAAEIDGANGFLVFLRIALPLSTPVIAVMILYYGVGYWNSWFNALIYLRERKYFPLQLILREILIANSTEDMMSSSMNVGASEAKGVSETIKYATIVVATLPILCIYPFLQKYFVKGVMVGAIKG